MQRTKSPTSLRLLAKSASPQIIMRCSLSFIFRDNCRLTGKDASLISPSCGLNTGAVESIYSSPALSHALPGEVISKGVVTKPLFFA